MLSLNKINAKLHEGRSFHLYCISLGFDCVKIEMIQSFTLFGIFDCHLFELVQVDDNWFSHPVHAITAEFVANILYVAHQ